MKKVFFLLLAGISLQAQMYVKKDVTYQSFTLTHSTSLSSPQGNPMDCITNDGSVFWLNSDVAKYLPTGKMDMAFATNGHLNVVTNNLVMASKIFLANNNLYISANNNLQKIGKFNFNGVKDVNFGTNGVLSLPNFNLNIFKFIQNNDGSLFANIVDKTDGWKQKLIKLTSNGVVDTSFASINEDVGSYFYRFEQLSNNDILIIYKNSSTATIYAKKFSVQGVLDTTFGNQGVAVLNVQSGNIKVNSLNEIFILENSTTQQSITKYAPNGLIDSNFGTNGVFNTSLFGIGNTLNVNNIDFDSSNHVLLFGGITGANKSFIARINNDGSLDTTFHNNRSYSLVSDMLAGNISGKVITDNEYICFNRAPQNSWVNYTSFKYIRNSIPTLAVEDFEKTKFEIYPNPASDYIHVIVGDGEKINTITVNTMTGQHVSSTNKENVNIKNLKTGNYIIQVVTNKKTYRGKFIKK